MSNFFSDNQDLQFQFSQLDLTEIVDLLGKNDGQNAPSDSYASSMDTYQASLDLLGEIAAREIAPLSAAIDANGTNLIDGRVEYSRETVAAQKVLADAGFMGVMLPSRFGGSGFPATIYMMMIEMVSRADASLMTLFGYQDVGELIARFGSEEQRQAFLPKLASGEHIGAIVLSEPGAGSDLQAIRLAASEADNGEWTLNGTKHFISNGGGDVLMVLARSEPRISNIFGLSLFVCRGSDRIKVRRIEKKMGLHGSPTCELEFDDAPAQLIGKRRAGLTNYVLESLNQARFSVAAQALGIAEGAFQLAVEYAGQRSQFGRKIVEFAAIQRMIDDMERALQSSRSLLYYSVRWLDIKTQLTEAIAHGHIAKGDIDEARKRQRIAGQYVGLLSPLVKYVATEAANRVCIDAQQVFGGLGYMHETGLERRVRDVRITTIYEGTSQVQVSAALRPILSDVLGDLFDEMSRTEFPSALQECNAAISSSRSEFKALLAVLSESDNEQLNDAIARDLADIYSQILGSYLLLIEAKTRPERTPTAEVYCAELRVNLAATSEALSAGRFRRWQAG